MSSILRFLGYVICTIVGVIGMGSAAIVGVLYFYAKDLPDHNFLKEYHPDVATRVFLQDGSKLCEYANERRYFVPISRIPMKLINAFIAVEDKRFFEHHGLDFYGIARSIVKNIENYVEGKRPQGASTITQQVARIFLIKSNEVSYVRKIKEAILSFRIENTLSKWQILELYLNQLYIGMGAYGVAAAAKIYFDKSLEELSVGECAYIAALAKGANNYHPVLHHDKAIARRNWAIDRQLENGYISKREAELAKQEELNAIHPIFDVSSNYFSEEVRKFLKMKFPDESLNKNGLVVRATLVPKFQKAAYSALRRGLEATDRHYKWRGSVGSINVVQSQKNIITSLQKFPKVKGLEDCLRSVVILKNKKGVTILTENGKIGYLNSADVVWCGKNLQISDVILVRKNRDKYQVVQVPKVQGAIIVIEVDSGRILAMQGGYSFEQSEFNRAVQALRQTGSAFKPFVYLTGLDNGFAPNSLIDASNVEIDLGEKIGIWKPKNYKNIVLDTITFRRAIERSINTATVRIAQEVGIDKVARTAETFGIFQHMPKYFAYTLGAGETTLLKLTTAYAMIANGGKKIEPTMIDYVQDRYGHTILKTDNRHIDNNIDYFNQKPPALTDIRPQIFDERSVYQLTSLLEGVVQRGSAYTANCFKFPLAGKTGTSNDSRDTWFIGYTQDIAIGIYVGFDDQSKSLGAWANGTNVALPIFIDFMNQIKDELSPKPFRIPSGIKLRQIDVETGGPVTEDTKISIWEAFKENEHMLVQDKTLNLSNTPQNQRNDQSNDEFTTIQGIY